MALLATACGAGRKAERVSQAQESPSEPPELTIEYSFPPINSLVNGSDAGITGTVEAIREPQWNSDDDEPYTLDDTDPPALSWRYRLATIDVSRVLWSSSELPLKPNDAVEVFLLGDGTETGGSVYDGVRRNSVSGRATKDDKVLMLLKRGTFGFKPEETRTLRYEPVIRLYTDFLGNWTLDGDRAVSLLPERTVPAEPLIARLLRERATGHKRSDVSGRFDPLDESQPSPNDTEGPRATP